MLQADAHLIGVGQHLRGRGALDASRGRRRPRASSQGGAPTASPSLCSERFPALRASRAAAGALPSSPGSWPGPAASRASRGLRRRGPATGEVAAARAENRGGEVAAGGPLTRRRGRRACIIFAIEFSPSAMPFIKSPIEAPPSPCIAAIACFSRAVASASSPPMSEASDESDASAPPPDGTPSGSCEVRAAQRRVRAGRAAVGRRRSVACWPMASTPTLRGRSCARAAGKAQTTNARKRKRICAFPEREIKWDVLRSRRYVFR